MARKQGFDIETFAAAWVLLTVKPPVVWATLFSLAG